MVFKKCEPKQHFLVLYIKMHSHGVLITLKTLKIS
jgi:hypothetical protein